MPDTLFFTWVGRESFFSLPSILPITAEYHSAHPVQQKTNKREISIFMDVTALLKMCAIQMAISSQPNSIGIVFVRVRRSRLSHPSFWFLIQIYHVGFSPRTHSRRFHYSAHIIVEPHTHTHTRSNCALLILYLICSHFSTQVRQCLQIQTHGAASQKYTRAHTHTRRTRQQPFTFEAGNKKSIPKPSEK